MTRETNRLRTLTLALAAALVLAAPTLATNNAIDVPSKVTYAEHVAPILNSNCASCHRPDDIAPMSLLTYDEVRPWAKSIRRAIEEGTMPPWHADARYGKFKNDRSLTDSEKAILTKWVKTGAKAGDLATAENAPVPADGWRLGEPDYILELDEVSLPAGGPDVFHDLVKKPTFEGDRWLRAVEVKAGNRKVLHHVILFASEGGGPPESGWLGAWAAGMDPMVFPKGTAKLVKDGSVFVADMHYHPDFAESTDQTQIGLYFYDGEPEKELINLWVQNAGFKIPAGAPNHQVKASYRFQQDSTIHGLLPHMHYRGKDFTYTATYPDGTSEVLLKVNAYDFNWQTLYEVADPIKVPAGTRIDCVAHFDNSTSNPDNPDPTRDVTFGNESYDEMMIGFVDYVVDEGVRPMSLDDRMATELSRLSAKYPGEVYDIRLREEDEQESASSVLYLPAEGDGLWLIPVNGQMFESEVQEIVRDGDSMTAKVVSPVGNFDVSGKVEGSAIQGSIVIPFDDDNIVFKGRVAKPKKAKGAVDAP